MALTRSFGELAQRRVASNAAFGEALLRDGIDMMLIAATSTPANGALRPRSSETDDGERLDHRTSRPPLTGSAAPYGIREHTLHSPEIGDFRANFRQVTCRELAHLSACALRIIR
jgi:hypothetical protein